MKKIFSLLVLSCLVLASYAQDIYICKDGDYTKMKLSEGLAIDLKDAPDSITFTAGVGEHSSFVRKLICEKLSFLGVKLNDVANDNVEGEALISLPDSKISVYVIPTDEELAIARQTMELINSKADKA